MSSYRRMLGLSGVDAEMPDPLDDLPAAHRADGEAHETAAEHEPGRDRLEVLERNAQGDESSEESIGDLDTACGDHESSNLCSHRPG